MLSPSIAGSAFRGPSRLRIAGSLLGTRGELWTTTNTAAPKVAGRFRTMASNTPIDPAEPPIAMISRRSPFPHAFIVPSVGSDHLVSTPDARAASTKLRLDHNNP